jgi:hypothetical protein
MNKTITMTNAVNKFSKGDRSEGSRARLHSALYEYFHYQGINRNTSRAWATEVERKILKRWKREDMPTAVVVDGKTFPIEGEDGLQEAKDELQAVANGGYGDEYSVTVVRGGKPAESFKITDNRETSQA